MMKKLILGLAMLGMFGVATPSAMARDQLLGATPQAPVQNVYWRRGGYGYGYGGYRPYYGYGGGYYGAYRPSYGYGGYGYGYRPYYGYRPSYGYRPYGYGYGPGIGVGVGVY